MLKLFQARPGLMQPGAEIAALYALQDFLEMRSELPEQKRNRFLTQIRNHLDLSGELRPLPAFMVGTQAVLCVKEALPENYWVYDPHRECLRVWKESSLTPDMA